MWSGRNPWPPSASVSISVWGSWPRQEACSQPSPSERLLIERMVYPGHKGGHNLTPFQKPVIQPEMFPLPRLRFLEAVGVFLEKHKTPSQEFHEEKTWQPERPHLGICLVCEYTLFCLPQTTEQGRAAARLLPAPLGCGGLQGPRQVSWGGAHTQTRASFLQDKGQRVHKAKTQSSPEQGAPRPLSIPASNISQTLATSQASFLVPVLNNTGNSFFFEV